MSPCADNNFQYFSHLGLTSEVATIVTCKNSSIELYEMRPVFLSTSVLTIAISLLDEDQCQFRNVVEVSV